MHSKYERNNKIQKRLFNKITWVYSITTQCQYINCVYRCRYSPWSLETFRRCNAHLKPIPQTVMGGVTPSQATYKTTCMSIHLGKKQHKRHNDAHQLSALNQFILLSFFCIKIYLYRITHSAGQFYNMVLWSSIQHTLTIKGTHIKHRDIHNINESRRIIKHFLVKVKHMVWGSLSLNDSIHAHSHYKYSDNVLSKKCFL